MNKRVPNKRSKVLVIILFVILILLSTFVFLITPKEEITAKAIIAIEKTSKAIPSSHSSLGLKNLIFPIAADKLNKDKIFVEDVYDFIRYKDNLWKTIPPEHYIRVVFEKKLSNNNDIRIYAKSNSSQGANVEVYEKDSNIKIAEFSRITQEEKEHRILLKNLIGLQDTFDLKVIGGWVSFDYIVDPMIPLANGGIFTGTESELGTDFNDPTFYGLEWDNQYYDTDVFSYSAGTPTQIQVKQAGDYFVALSIPIRDSSLSGSNNNRANIQAWIYVNGSAYVLGPVMSSYLRGEGNAIDHYESGDQMAILVPDLGAGDYIEIEVRGLDDSAEVVVSENGFALFIEKVDSSEEIFHGYGTTTTAPTSSTNFNQATNQDTFPYEVEWTSAIKDGTYTHTDGTSTIDLADIGYYYVTVNIPLYGDGTARQTVCARVELDNAVITGGNMLQGYVRSNTEGNEEASLHWAGLVETSSANQDLSVGVGRCADPTGTTTTGGQNATIYIRQFADGNQGLFHSTATQVTGSFPNEWNPTTEVNIIWEAANEKDTTYYTHTDGNESIMFNLPGYYLLSFNSPALYTTGQREAPQFRVYLDKVLQPGSRTGSTYIRDNTGHENSSTSLVYLLNITKYSNLTLGVRREISNTSTASVSDLDPAVLLLEYKGPRTSPPSVTINNPSNNSYIDSTDVLLNVTLNEIGECNYTLDEGTTNNTMGTFDNLTFNVTPTMSEGINFARFYCYNQYAQINDTETVYFTVDLTNPLISYGPQTLINDSNISRDWIYANVSVTETNEANITYELHNETSLVNSSTYDYKRRLTNWTNLPDGVYYYNVTVKDLVNRQNYTETRKITLDTNYPNISFTVPTYDNDSYVPQDSITVTVSAEEDNEENITFFLYNETHKIKEDTFTDNRRAITWTLLPDAKYYYNVTIIDVASNENSTETRWITLDHVYPVVDYTPLSIANNLNLSQDFIYINVTVTETNEANITFELHNDTMRVNSSVYTDQRREINWTNLPNGNYTYNVTVVDKANLATSTNSRKVFLDNIFPQISFIDPTLQNNTNISRNYVFVNISALEINEANITFELYNSSGRWNRTVTQDKRREINWTNLADGWYEYNVTIQDFASNTNITETRLITLDATNPSATLVSPENNSYSNETQQNLTVDASDTNALSNITLFVFNESGMEINQTTWDVSGQSILTGILYTFAYEGIFNWFYRILDVASNSYETQNNTIIIDTTFPLISYSGGTESNYENFTRSWIYVNVSTTEDNFANITFELHDSTQLINRTTFTDQRREINWTGLSDKKYFYNVTIIDLAHQTNTTTTYQIGLDNTPPNVNIIEPQSKSYAYNISLEFNHTITDNVVGYDSCWWNLDNTANQSINCGTNTTFNTSDGSHTIYLFANDTLNNYIANAVSFSVSTQGPAMVLVSPENDTFLDSTGTVYLNYTAEGPEGMTNCTLYGNWGGGWHLNQTTKGDDWWNTTFLYRKKLNVTAVSAVTTNYTVGVEVDTVGPEFQDDGDDIRVTYWNGTHNNEIDRLLLRPNNTETIVQFRLQVDLSSNDFDENYSIYYGNPTASSPPDNGSIVWYFYDDFSQGNINQWGYITGDVHLNTSFENPWTGVNYTLGMGACGNAITKVLPAYFPAQQNLQLRALWLDNPYSACTGGSPDADGILGLRGSASTTYDGLLIERDTDTGFHYDTGGVGLASPNDYPLAEQYSPFEVWQWSENEAYGTDPQTHRAKYWLQNETEPTFFQIPNATSISATTAGLPFLRVASGTAIVAAVMGSVLVETEPTVTIQTEYWEGAFEVTLDSEGSYEWNVECFDNNHVGSFAFYNNTFFIDTQTPKIAYTSLTLPNNTNSSLNYIFVNVSVNESNQENITYALYNETHLYNSSTYTDDRRQITWSNLPEGLYEFNVTVFDRASRVNQTPTRKIKLDLTNPNAELLSPGNNTFSSQSSQNLTVNATDTNALANLTVYIYNELGQLINQTTRFVAGTGAVVGITYNFLTEELFSWFYRVFDVSGRSYETQNNTITIDQTNPLIEYGQNTLPNHSNRSDTFVFINVSVTETNEENITFSLYKEGVLLINNTYTTPIRVRNFTGLSDGNYSYNVTIFDKASNKNSTQTRNILLDNDLPEAFLLNPENETFTTQSQHNFTYNASDGAGLNSSTLFIFNETGSLIYNVTQNLLGSKLIISGNVYDFLVDGIFYWFYRVFDISGNKIDLENRTITLDLTSPQIDFVSLTKDNNSVVEEDFIFINVSVVEDYESNITFYLYNSTSQVYANFFDYARRELNWTLLPDETYYYNVTVYDSAGNSNTSETRKIILDNIPPVVDYTQLTFPDHVNVSQNFIFVNVSVNETNEENITFHLTDFVFEVNKSTYTDPRREINWTGLSDKTYYYNVTVLDKAGQSTTTQTREITLDTTYPLISFGAGTLQDHENISQSYIYIDITASDDNEANLTFGLYNDNGVVNESTYWDQRRNINFTDIPYGNVTYYYNVTISDYASNINYTETREIFLYDSAKPYVEIINPEAKNYTSNESLSLDYIAVDPNVDTCMYSIDSASNITLTNCQNTTFDVSDESWHTISLFVNDTSGNKNSTSVTFYVNSSNIETLDYKVQRGSTSVDGSSSAPIQETDKNKAFFLLNSRTTDSGGDSIQVIPSFVDSEEIRFENYDSGEGTTVDWELISGPDISVQRGEFTYGNFDNNTNISISAVNLSSSFIIIYNRLSDGTGGNNVRGKWTGKFINSTFIQLDRSYPGSSGEVSWQVVDWDSATVERGAFTTSGSSGFVAIGSTIQFNNTFLIFSERFLGTNTLESTNVRGRFDDTQYLQFLRVGTAGTAYVEWFVVSSDVFQVQNGTFTISNANDPVITDLQTLYNHSRAFNRHSRMSTGSGTTYANSIAATQLPNATHLLTNIGSDAGNTRTVNWQVIELVEQNSPTVNLFYDKVNFSNYSVILNYTADDQNTITNCTLYGNWTTGWGIKAFNDSQIREVISNFSNLNVVSDGNYKWNVRCIDLYGNIGENSTNFTFSAYIPPEQFNETLFNITQTKTDGKGEVTLTWNLSNHSTKYNIYYTDNLSIGFSLLGETSGNSFTDTTANQTRRRFYKVSGWNPSGENFTETYGKTVYYIKRKPNVNTRNWIGFYLEDNLTTANESLNEINNISSFTMYNATTQSRITCNLFSCPEFPGCTETNCNFNLENATGYEVNANSSFSVFSNWSFVGRIKTPVSKSLVRNSSSFGLNWVSIHYNTTMSKAYDLITSITWADAVTHWDTLEQTSQGYLDSPFPWVPYIGTNFDIEPETAYEVSVLTATTYTQT